MVGHQSLKLKIKVRILFPVNKGGNSLMEEHYIVTIKMWVRIPFITIEPVLDYDILIIIYFYLFSPFENKNEKIKIKYIYKKWKEIYEKTKPEVKNLMQILQDNALNLKIKQKKIEEYNNLVFKDILLNKLYNKSTILNKYKTKFMEYINSIDILTEFKNFNYLIFTKLLDLEIIYYYFIDILITGSRLLIQTEKNINLDNNIIEIKLKENLLKSITNFYE
jgi:hypothetical protein